MRKILAALGGFTLALVLGVGLAMAQNVPYAPASGIGVQTGHMQVGTLVPTVSSCGTGPAIVGDDSYGQVTMGTGSPTGCVITFKVPYNAAPLCSVTWQANIASMQYAVTATAITLTQTGTSSNKVDYNCRAQNGG